MVCRVGRFLGLGIGITGTVAGLVSCGGGGTSVAPKIASVTKASLGKALFFDTSLSNPVGMACATCHAPTKAFTDPRPGATSQGAVAGLFGFRKAPSIQYMAFSPTFDANGATGGGAIGGQFWDGRAATLEAQVKGPLLNPIEMGNASIQAVIDKVQAGAEAASMKLIYGANVFSNPATAFSDIQDAIATFERTPAISPFTSKFDAYLKGKVKLTAAEADGLSVFNGKGQCFNCHISKPLADGTPPLFTNFNYANIGLPKNPTNPYYTIPSLYNPLGASFVDFGLGVTTNRSTDQGLFMVPSLRNVAVRAPYFHNGGFPSLGSVILFYNSNSLGQVFGPPEVNANVNTTQVGNLGLNDQQTSDLIAFLQTLTDGYKASP